jgi:hypothetical protein
MSSTHPLSNNNQFGQIMAKGISRCEITSHPWWMKVLSDHVPQEPFWFIMLWWGITFRNAMNQKIPINDIWLFL